MTREPREADSDPQPLARHRSEPGDLNLRTARNPSLIPDSSHELWYYIPSEVAGGVVMMTYCNRGTATKAILC